MACAEKLWTWHFLVVESLPWTSFGWKWRVIRGLALAKSRNYRNYFLGMYLYLSNVLFPHRNCSKVFALKCVRPCRLEVRAGHCTQNLEKSWKIAKSREKLRKVAKSCTGTGWQTNKKSIRGLWAVLPRFPEILFHLKESLLPFYYIRVNVFL